MTRRRRRITPDGARATTAHHAYDEPPGGSHLALDDAASRQTRDAVEALFADRASGPAWTPDRKRAARARA